MHHLIVSVQPQHAASSGSELESQNSHSFIKPAPGASASTHQGDPRFWRQAGVILQGECSQMVAGGTCGHQLIKSLQMPGSKTNHAGKLCASGVCTELCAVKQGELGRMRLANFLYTSMILYWNEKDLNSVGEGQKPEVSSEESRVFLPQGFILWLPFYPCGSTCYYCPWVAYWQVALSFRSFFFFSPLLSLCKTFNGFWSLREISLPFSLPLLTLQAKMC